LAKVTLEEKIKARNAAARGYLSSGDPDIEEYNFGELLQVAKNAGLGAHRGLSKNDLIDIIDGERRPSANPVDEVRDKMMSFVRLYWERIKHQMPEQCEGDCYQCSDLKVLACYAENQENLFKRR
jgi:hypothetical protein